MAGFPIYRKFVADLTISAKAEGLEDAQEYLLSRIASGDSLIKICKDHDVSRWTGYKFIQRAKFEDEYRKVREEQAADAMIEKAEQQLQDADEDSKGGVTKAKALADFAKFRAAADNSRFRDAGKGPDTVINFNALHLDSLRSTGGPENQALPKVPIQVEGEVVEDE